MRFYWMAKEMEMEIEHSEGEKGGMCMVECMAIRI